MGPKIKTRGELPTFINLPPSGIQNLSEPLANEGGENLGVQGGEAPMTGGVGGVPHKIKIRG